MKIYLLIGRDNISLRKYSDINHLFKLKKKDIVRLPTSMTLTFGGIQN